MPHYWEWYEFFLDEHGNKVFGFLLVVRLVARLRQPDPALFEKWYQLPDAIRLRNISSNFSECEPIVFALHYVVYVLSIGLHAVVFIADLKRLPLAVQFKQRPGAFSQIQAVPNEVENHKILIRSESD